MFCKFAACLLVVAAVSGCQDSDSSNSDTSEATVLQGRLEAAIAIYDTKTREPMLVQIAKEAAALGDVEVTKAALNEIIDTNSRDAAAVTSSLSLAELGKTSEATDVAEIIYDTDTRDDTLIKIANGNS